MGLRNEYRITVKNPNGVSSGVLMLLVDGDLTKGNTVPILGSHGVHEVEVILGETNE